MHPDDLLRRLTSTQVSEWRAFLEMEDKDQAATEKARLELESLWVGLICSTVANFSPISKRHDWVPRDFVGGGEEKPAATVAEELKAFFGAGRKIDVHHP